MRVRSPTARRTVGYWLRPCLLAGLAAACIHAQIAGAAAPLLPPDYANSDRMHYCQWFSIQAAWGAQARFKGAPPTFQYVDRVLLYDWFMADSAPSDAVYLLDELGVEDRRIYEEAALLGWERMDAWLQSQPDMEPPDWTLLPVPFYYICKDGKAR